MAEPYPLWKSPRGLIELFRLRTNGRNPDQFATAVQPVADVQDFYGADLLFTADTAAAAAAFPITQTIDVAFTRRFWGFSFQITLGAAAGTRLSLRIGMRVPSSGSAVYIVAQTVYTAGLVAAQNYNTFVNFPRPIVLSSGAQFVCVAVGDAGGADHVATSQSLSESFNPG